MQPTIPGSIAMSIPTWTFPQIHSNASAFRDSWHLSWRLHLGRLALTIASRLCIHSFNRSTEEANDGELSSTITEDTPGSLEQGQQWEVRTGGRNFLIGPHLEVDGRYPTALWCLKMQWGNYICFHISNLLTLLTLDPKFVPGCFRIYPCKHLKI